jgi:segregation and condensation protein B
VPKSTTSPKSTLSPAAELEAILFVASEPLSLRQLSLASARPEDEVARALKNLASELTGRGLRLSHAAGTYRLVSAPEAAKVVLKHLQATTSSELSRAALETLAIIAYRGPLTKPAIDEIRGVTSDIMIRSLLGRGLIQEAGRATGAARLIQYCVSHTFLQHFGLTSTDALPPLEENTDAN